MRIERVSRCCGSRGSLSAVDFQPHANPRSVHRLATASTTEVQIWALWRPGEEGVSKEPIKCVCLFSFKGHAPHEVATVRWSPNGRYLASTDSGGVTHILERNEEKTKSLEKSLQRVLQSNKGGTPPAASESTQPTITKETRKYTFKYDGTVSNKTKSNPDTTKKESSTKSTRISFDSQTVQQKVVKPTTVENSGGNYEIWTPLQPIRCPARMGQLFDISWAPDNRSIVGGGLNGQVAVFDIHSKQVVAEFDVFEGIYPETALNVRGYVKSVAWDPMTLYIAVQTNNRQVSVWRRSPPNPKGAPSKWSFKRVLYDDELFKKTQNDVLGGSRISWTPNGQVVAFPNGGVGDNNFAACFEVVHADVSRQTNLLVDGKVEKARLQFVYDIADHNVRPDPMLLRGHQSRVRNVRFSQDLLVSHKRGLCKGVTFADSDRFIFYAQTSDDGLISIWRFKQSSNWHSHYKNEAQCICIIQNALDEQSSMEDLAWGNSGKWLAVASSQGGLLLVEMGEDETYTRYFSNWMQGRQISDTHELSMEFLADVEKHVTEKEKEQTNGNDDVAMWMANSSGPANQTSTRNVALGMFNCCEDTKQVRICTKGNLFNSLKVGIQRRVLKNSPIAAEMKSHSGQRNDYLSTDEVTKWLIEAWIVLTIRRALEGLVCGSRVTVCALIAYLSQLRRGPWKSQRCLGNACRSYEMDFSYYREELPTSFIATNSVLVAPIMKPYTVRETPPTYISQGNLTYDIDLDDIWLCTLPCKRRNVGYGRLLVSGNRVIRANMGSVTEALATGTMPDTDNSRRDNHQGAEVIEEGEELNFVMVGGVIGESDEANAPPQQLHNGDGIIDANTTPQNSLDKKEEPPKNTDSVKKSQRKPRRSKGIKETNDTIIDVWLNMDYSHLTDLLADYWQNSNEEIESTPKAVTRDKQPALLHRNTTKSPAIFKKAESITDDLDEVAEELQKTPKKQSVVPKPAIQKPPKVSSHLPQINGAKSDPHSANNIFEPPCVRPVICMMVSSQEGQRKIFALNNSHDDVPATISCVDAMAGAFNVKWMKNVVEGYVTHISTIRGTDYIMVVSQIGELLQQFEESTSLKRRRWSRDQILVSQSGDRGISKRHINRERSSFITILDSNNGTQVLGPCEVPDLNVSNVYMFSMDKKLYATLTATNDTISVYSLDGLDECRNGRIQLLFSCSIDTCVAKERYGDIMHIQLLNVSLNAAVDGEEGAPFPEQDISRTPNKRATDKPDFRGLSALREDAFGRIATYREGCEVDNRDPLGTPINRAYSATQTPLKCHFSPSSNFFWSVVSPDTRSNPLPVIPFENNVMNETETDTNMYAIMVYMRNTEVYVLTKHYHPICLEHAYDHAWFQCGKPSKRMLSLRSIEAVYQNKVQLQRHERATLFTKLLHRLAKTFQLHPIIKDECTSALKRHDSPPFDEVAVKQRLLISSLVIGSRTEYIVYLYEYIRHIVGSVCVEEIADAVSTLYKTSIDAGISGWNNMCIKLTCFDAHMLNVIGIDAITVLRQFIVPLLRSLHNAICDECQNRNLDNLGQARNNPNADKHGQGCHKYCAMVCPVDYARMVIKNKETTTDEKLLKMHKVCANLLKNVTAWEKVVNQL